MRRTKIKEIRFFEPMYQTDISYLVGGDVPQLQQFIKERHGNAKMYSWGKRFKWGKKANTTNAYQFHVTAPLGKGEVFYVWIEEKTDYLMFHESFHLLGDIMYDRGVKYCSKSEEAFAYLGGYIYQEVNKLMKRKVRK